MSRKMFLINTLTRNKLQNKNSQEFNNGKNSS